MPKTATRRASDRTRDTTSVLAYYVIVYVVAVLVLDLLATYNYLPSLRWTHPNGFDYFKFVFWLLIPFAVSLPGMDWGYFGFTRWKRRDAFIFGGLTCAGLAALFLVPLIPQLSAMYPNRGDLPVDMKRAMIAHYLMWDVSWLFGWEFLHRYFLLRAVAARWPRFGWLLIPLSEGLYHWPKSPVEAAGMVVFSVVATWWTMRRQNLLLPLFAHAAIELALLFVLFG